MSDERATRLFFTEVERRAIARQDPVDLNLREQPTPGYVLLGVRGRIHHKRMNLAAGVDNLLNRFYCDHLSLQRDPFHICVRVLDPRTELVLKPLSCSRVGVPEVQTFGTVPVFRKSGLSEQPIARKRVLQPSEAAT